MATPKKKSAAARAAATNKASAGRSNRDEEETEESEDEEVEREAFDYNAFFAEGGVSHTEEDLRDVGALMPIYASEHAYNEEWPPLYGLLVNRVEIKVAKEETDENKQWRFFYVVEAEIATKALSGTGGDREVIDIEPGDYVLMPESGALKNKDRLKMAAIDPDWVHHSLFRVTGQLDLKKAGRNPMWEIESFLVGDPAARKGRYALNNTSRERPAELPAHNAQNGQALPPGTVVNKRTGAVNERLVG